MCNKHAVATEVSEQQSEPHFHLFAQSTPVSSSHSDATVAGEPKMNTLKEIERERERESKLSVRVRERMFACILACRGGKSSFGIC